MPDSLYSCSPCHRLSVVSAVRFAASIVAATSLAWAQSGPGPTASSDSEIVWSEPQDLLKGELTSQWKHFSSVSETPLPSVWQRIGGKDQSTTELLCTGNPRGFLYTSQQFGEFELSFEWRYVSDPNGNSGVMVFTQDDRRLWPTSIQVQLHQPEAGSVFPSGEAVTDASIKKEGLAKPVGEWNKCRIVSHSGRVLVHVNGEKSGEVTGCKPATGCIAIQSEGSEVRFRRILVRTPAPPPPAENSEETPAP